MILRFFAWPYLEISILSMALLIGAGSTANSDETNNVYVITSGGFTAGYNRLAPEFEKRTGINLFTAYGASSGGAPNSIPERLKRNERADVIILSRPSLDRLTEAGDVEPDSRTDLVRSSIGMAVRAGADVPDISTTGAFLSILRNAESIGYSASASGTYLSTDLFPRLGIMDWIEPKATRVVSERVGSVIARGEVEIGFQQVSEILPIEGITYVGPIPDEYQKITIFSAGIVVGADNRSGAQQLIEFLSSIDVVATIEETGLDAIADNAR